MKKPKKPSPVWCVVRTLEDGITHLVAAYSTKEDAEYFMNNIYGDGVDRLYISEDLPNLYLKDGWFVYYVMLDETKDKSNDLFADTDKWKWTVDFVGYSMDLSDEAGVVFSNAKGKYSVVALASTKDNALKVGQKIIREAREGGPYNKDYSKKGYIKTYTNEEAVETPPEELESKEESLLERFDRSVAWIKNKAGKEVPFLSGYIRDLIIEVEKLKESGK